MNKENETLLGLLKDAQTEISRCFSLHIASIDDYEHRKAKHGTLAAAKASPSSQLAGLKDIAAANEAKASSQAATFKLQVIADSVDRELENYISQLTSNSGE